MGWTGCVTIAAEDCPRGGVVGTGSQPQAVGQNSARPRTQQTRPPSTIARRLARQLSRRGQNSGHPERRLSSECGIFPCFRHELPYFTLTAGCWSFQVSMLVIFIDFSCKIGSFLTDTNYVTDVVWKSLHNEAVTENH